MGSDERDQGWAQRTREELQRLDVTPVWGLAALIVVTMAVAVYFGADGGRGPTSDSESAATGLAVGTGGAARPVLLIFGAGSFVIGDARRLESAAALAAGHGFEARSIDYPQLDLRAAVAVASAAAAPYQAEGRPVFAYGESAGGTLAAVLAVRGRVDGAATYAQLSDMPPFAADSPRVPVLALAPADDPRSAATMRWDDREPRVHCRKVPGGHLGDPADPSVYTANVDRALGWLEREAGSSD